MNDKDSDMKEYKKDLLNAYRSAKPIARDCGITGYELRDIVNRIGLLTRIQSVFMQDKEPINVEVSSKAILDVVRRLDEQMKEG